MGRGLAYDALLGRAVGQPSGSDMMPRGLYYGMPTEIWFLGWMGLVRGRALSNLASMAGIMTRRAIGDHRFDRLGYCDMWRFCWSASNVEYRPRRVKIRTRIRL